ncbi:UDP-N-acetylmuramoyl-L-alanine--D-glutamate ligase [Patescibacteria group bacterium]|nr:UDP-N-acetylmuramoyl-L-alanine--D-glutamate ligase [Patescibacteria group bacterium]MCL5010234.1 UDP-N-acetylmuramoyl-L-alanine--D-glutamate ligase [Patescibacteria group bacterium]
MKELKGKSVLLLGYGQESQSTHRYLKENHPDISISIADRNPKAEPIFDVDNAYLGKDYLANLLGFDVIVRSPGIPVKTPELERAKETGIEITSAMNIFFSECLGATIGVTGTKGKSTTASLIEKILAQKYKDVRLVGNIGNPALDQLTDSGKETIFVVELSSYQLADLRFSPSYAVVLGILEEHLDYHGSLSEYVKAKQNIVTYQNTDNYVIFNGDNSLARSLAQNAESTKIAFSTKDKNEAIVYAKAGKIYYRPDAKNKSNKTEIMNVSDIPLLGRGNLENVLAASACGMLFGITPKNIRKTVREFKALEHRLNFIGEKDGIRFYDDSLSTIPAATINALEALGENVETLIAGGFDRGISFGELGEYLTHCKLKNLILFPASGTRIWNAVKRHNKNGNLPKKFNVSTMKEAVNTALANTSAGKICLLSPASPSFGIFKDYKDRGNQFRRRLGFY